MLKYLSPKAPKECPTCKLDLFKEQNVYNGWVCGRCTQQYLVTANPPKEKESSDGSNIC